MSSAICSEQTLDEPSEAVVVVMLSGPFGRTILPARAHAISGLNTARPFSQSGVEMAILDIDESAARVATNASGFADRGPASDRSSYGSDAALDGNGGLVVHD